MFLGLLGDVHIFNHGIIPRGLKNGGSTYNNHTYCWGIEAVDENKAVVASCFSKECLLFF